jgi:hypothetical protein
MLRAAALLEDYWYQGLGREMLTDDSGFHVTRGDVHLTASLSRLAPICM